MGKQYRHLDQKLRDRIAALKRAGHSHRSIGDILDIDHTTVGREIRRNSFGDDDRTPADKQGIYDPGAAQHKAYVRRHNAKYQGKKIHENSRLKAFVVTNVQRGWNPDEIAGYLKLHRARLGFYASKTTIYEWFDSVYGERYKRYLYAHRSGSRHRPRATAAAAHIPDRTPVSERPESATGRQEVGHYEFDAIVGMKHSDSPAGLAVVQERSTRLLQAGQVISLAPRSYAETIVGLLAGHRHIQTLTTDNGLENRQWQVITTKTNAPVYFTEPYSSWQKGGVENANKLLRRYFPKGTDFTTVTQGEVYRAVQLINKKPRRCLGYKSALQLAKEKGVLP